MWSALIIQRYIPNPDNYYRYGQEFLVVPRNSRQIFEILGIEISFPIKFNFPLSDSHGFLGIP